MNKNIENRYCQSCGMPLNLLRNEYLGTNADESLSDEYCYYCLKDGKYTVDYSMQQMIDVWVKYTDKYNDYSDTNLTPQELESILQERMPELKRWKQRQETESLHTEIINRIQVYINKHLFEDLNSKDLAQIACLSHFHFRRIFKAHTGENMGAYVQRLRLEYVAYKLVFTNLSLKEILDSIHIYNKSSLSKAFAKHFGISPSEYRYSHRQTQENGLKDSAENLTPRLTRMSQMSCACMPVRGQQKNIRTYQRSWEQVKLFKSDMKLDDKENRYVSISMDEPFITERKQCRFYLGITVDESVKPAGAMTMIDIAAGYYAVFPHRGSHAGLPGVYRDIYQNWLPGSGYIQSEPLTFEVYYNTPSEVPEDNLLTEIYIPIQKSETNNYD